MLLHRKGLLSRSSILGTDISRDSLNLANQATYRDWSLRGKGKELAAPYLSEVDGQYRVNDKIRKSVHFEYLNLALDNYPSTVTGTRGVDLILCRNVMIYFDQATIHSIVNRFHRCLVPGGWLVTAASDPPIHELDLFDVVATDNGMVFRKFEQESRKQFAGPGGPQAGLATKANEDAALRLSNAQLSAATMPSGMDAASRLAAAKTAMQAGQYEQAAAIAAPFTQTEEAAVIHIKALANRDIQRAERACEAATKQQPLSIELHYLHAILLIDLNRQLDAAAALQRVLYLDRTLALPHFSLATVFRTLGKLRDARRELLLARERCVGLDAGQLIPLGEDQRVGDLLEMINLQLDAVDRATGGRA